MQTIYYPNSGISVFISCFQPGKRLQLRSVIFLLLVSFVSVNSRSQVSFSTTTLPTGMEFTPAGTGLVIPVDFNNDGYTDILYNVTAGGALTYLQSSTGTSFATPGPNPFGSYTSASPAGTNLSVASSCADFDHDGDPDIWVRVSGAANDVFLRNDAGTYVTATPITGMEFTAATVTYPQVVDINGDGYVDIVYNTAPGGGITYLQNNNGTSFSTPTPNPFASYTSSTPASTSTAITSSEFADYDGDGDLDLWVRVAGAGNDVYLRNDAGTYTTASLPTGLEFTGAGIGAVKIADMNGDGLVDYIYQAAAASAITYMENTGSGFATPSPNPFASYTSSTPTGVLMNSAGSVADMDGDGDLDLWIRVGGASNDFFSTASGAAPRCTLTSPANNATGVSVTNNIVLTFSEAMTTGSGSFTIRRVFDNGVVETIAASGPNVSGSGTNVITINPVSNLSSGTQYYVTFDRNALKDGQGVIAGHLDSYMKVRVPETTSGFLKFTTSGVAPVTWLSISAYAINNQVNIDWQTATEWNSRDFTVQHSVDGANWKNIGTLAAAGNSNQVIRYQFIHKAPAPGKNYYRILQSDLDGKSNYSVIRTVNMEIAKVFKVFPNPAGSVAWVSTTLPGEKTLTVYTLAGVRVIEKTSQASLIPVSTQALSPGMYQLVLVSGTNRSVQLLMVK